MDKPAALPKEPKLTFRRDFRRRKLLYFMCVPGVLTYLVFFYLPMYGISIAFLDYNPYTGLEGLFTSQFVGFQWFARMFRQSQFKDILCNTLLINVYSLLWSFPMPIILAICLNEVRHTGYKKVVQTVSYLPYFLSWAIVTGFLYQLLGLHNSPVNGFLLRIGAIEKPIMFTGSPRYFRTIIIASSIWKNMGWSSILYLAAIVGIDSTLFEAATIDGAGKLQQVLHVILPGILPVISICLILDIGKLMSSGFDQIFLLLSPNTFEVGDVFSTYIYRMGVKGGQFSYTTAIGLFQNAVNFALVISSNLVTKRLTGSGIW